MKASILRFLALPLLPLLLGACVSFRWERDLRFAPLPESSIDSLVPGRDGLQVVLDRLGAPLWVNELPGGALSLAYGWSHARGLGFNVHVPITSDVSGTVDYTDTRQEMPGLLAVFDPELTLIEVRRGLLRDLTLERGRQRPSAPSQND